MEEEGMEEKGMMKGGRMEGEEERKKKGEGTVMESK